MIVGLGIECVDAERFGALHQKNGERLLGRLFTEKECQTAGSGKRSVERLAVRFAAKVATRRALFGSPMKGATIWQDFEVHTAPSGQPEMHLAGEARLRAETLGVQRVHLTLSHDFPHCIGHVLLEGHGD